VHKERREIDCVMPRYFSMRSSTSAGCQRFQPSSSVLRIGSPRTCTGLWMARCGMYRQNGPSLFRSMNLSAYRLTRSVPYPSSIVSARPCHQSCLLWPPTWLTKSMLPLW
jgi:hypothetical protein